MPVIQLEAQPPTENLLKAVEQLDAQELERFASNVNALVAKRIWWCIFFDVCAFGFVWNPHVSSGWKN